MGQRGKVVKGTESQGDLKFEISESKRGKGAKGQRGKGAKGTEFIAFARFV